jgi:hypothetical protein
MTFANTSNHPDAVPWAMSVFYETPGDVDDRYARIIDDPTATDNKVLHLWLKNAVIDAGFAGHTKGRVQTGFPGRAIASKFSCPRWYSAVLPRRSELTGGEGRFRVDR